MEYFIKKYLEDRPAVLERVKALETKRGLNLLGKLLNEKNEVNLLSWRSEMEFGFFFDEFSDVMNFERSINGKRPDWTLTMKGQKLLAEVLKINTKENELLQRLEKDRQFDEFRKKIRVYR